MERLIIAGLKQMCFHKSAFEKKWVILRWGGTRRWSLCVLQRHWNWDELSRGCQNSMASLHTVKNMDHHCISTSSAGQSIETCHQMPLLKLYIINAHTIHLLVLANIQWHVTSLHSGKVHKNLQQGVVKLKLNHLKIWLRAAKSDTFENSLQVFPTWCERGFYLLSFCTPPAEACPLLWSSGLKTPILQNCKLALE